MARNLPLRAGFAAIAPFVVLAAAYVAARLVAFTGVEARSFRDTIDYNQVAAAPIFSKKFLAGDHPPTVPFAYKLLGTADGARLAGQLLFSMASWLTLAAAVACVLRRPIVRVVAFGAVLCFSLASQVLLWDALLLSESISLSLTALLVATWLLFVWRPSAWTLAPMLVVTGFWTLARDPHAYFLLMLAATMAVALVVPGRRLLRTVAIAGVLVIAAGSLVSASEYYKRWEYPLQNIIAKRIAADPPALRYFRDAGMPVTRKFLVRARRYRAGAFDPFQHPAGIADPAQRPKFLPFQFWLVKEGRHTYSEFLLTHPGYVAKAFGDLDHVLLDPHVEVYESDHPPGKFGALPKLFYPQGPVLPLVYVGLAALLAAAAARRARPPRTWAVPVFMLLSAVPFAVFVWHGEVLEIDRHGLIASMMLRLGALLLALMAVDRLVSEREGGR